MTELTEELTFRAASEADVPFLLELRRRTMSEHLRLSGIEPSESERVERVLANPARRLYERLGFRIVGENDQAYDMEFGG